MLTRRAFTKGSVAAAAAAVLKITPERATDTKMAMHLFGPEPITFDAKLRVDGILDVFEMEVLHEHGGVVARLPLSAVKNAVRTPGAAAKGIVRLWKDGILGPMDEETQLEITAKDDILTMCSCAEPGAPVWMPLADVRKVVP